MTSSGTTGQKADDVQEGSGARAMRPGADQAQLAAENRRLRDAAGQMQAEIIALSKQLEPLHALTEELEQQRRSYEGEQDKLRADMRRLEAKRQAEWQRREGEMLAALHRRDKELQAALRYRDGQSQEAADAWTLEQARWATERQRWNADLQERIAKVDELNERLRELYASTSWTATRPLRALSQLLQGLRG